MDLRERKGKGVLFGIAGQAFQSATMSAAATGEVGVCSGSAEASAVPAHEGRGLDEGLGREGQSRRGHANTQMNGGEEGLSSEWRTSRRIRDFNVFCMKS